MSFYSDFAGHYESVFPLEEDTYAFLARRARAGARVLDIGCGTGDYCGRFAADGHDALGIDLDSEMIDVARERFPEARFRVLDMGDLGSLGAGEGHGRFGCVFCIGNVLSHLPASSLPRFLDVVAELLSPGGAWVFQTVNWDHLLGLEAFRFPDVDVSGTDLVFEREYPSVHRDSTPFVTRLKRADQIVFQGEVKLYPLSADEYRAAHETRFLLRGHFGSFAESEFDPATMSSSLFHFERR